jgi:competence protein ComEC
MAAFPLAVFGIIVAVLARRHAVGFPLALGFACVAAGFAVATFSTARLAHPILRIPASSVSMSGFVEVREERERSDRIVVCLHHIDGRIVGETPERVRVVVRKDTAPPVGTFVSLKAHLSPPLAPLRPGGYDFARDMYFAKLGASGYALGKIQAETPPAGCFGHGAAFLRGHRLHAREDRQAHPRHHSRRRGRDSVGSAHRKARCHYAAGE